MAEERVPGGPDRERVGRKLERLTQQSQLDFELEFFARVLACHADYVDALRVHGNNLSAKGLYASGLDTDRRLVRLRPRDPLAHYNLACTYSLLHMSDASLAALELSLRLGYRDFEHMLGDADLEHIRRDERFMGLLCRYLKASRSTGV